MPRSELRYPQIETASEAVSARAARLADLVGDWRAQLLEVHERRRLEVVRSITSVIADDAIAELAAQRVLLIDQEFRRVSEAATVYLSDTARVLRESVMASIRPAAFAATGVLMEYLQASTEEERRNEEALRAQGWWFPPNLSHDLFLEVGRLARGGQRVAVRRTMAEAARSREMRWMVESWMRLEPFRGRRRFILDGLKDHRRGRYRVSIPTLLPHIEGIAIEAFTPGSTATNPKEAIRFAAATYDPVMGQATIEAATVLWAHQDFTLVAPGTRRLNRQLVLHGRSTGYATEENSAKVIFTLDLLASLVEEAQRHPERAKTP